LKQEGDKQLHITTQESEDFLDTEDLEDIPTLTMRLHSGAYSDKEKV